MAGRTVSSFLGSLTASKPKMLLLQVIQISSVIKVDKVFPFAFSGDNLIDYKEE